MIILLLIFLSCAGGSGSLSSSSNRKPDNGQINDEESNIQKAEEEKKNKAAINIQAACKKDKVREEDIKAEEEKTQNKATSNIQATMSIQTTQREKATKAKEEVTREHFIPEQTDDNIREPIVDIIEKEVLLRAVSNNKDRSDLIQEDKIYKVDIVYKGGETLILQLSCSTGEKEEQINLKDLEDEIAEYKQKNVDVFYKDGEGNTLSIDELLIEGNIEEKDKVKLSLMDWSKKDKELNDFIDSADIKDIELFIGLGIYKDREILGQIFERAHKENKKEEFAELALSGIKNGISIKDIDEDKCTVLMCAACHEEYIKIFKAILDRKESSEILYNKNKYGLTTLYYIILHLNIDAFNLLVEKSIDIKDLDFVSDDAVKIRPMSLFTTSLFTNSTEAEQKASTLANLLAGQGFSYDYISAELKDKLKIQIKD